MNAVDYRAQQYEMGKWKPRGYRMVFIGGPEDGESRIIKDEPEYYFIPIPTPPREVFQEGDPSIFTLRVSKYRNEGMEYDPENDLGIIKMKFTGER